MNTREKLVAHHKQTASTQIHELFNNDPSRASRYSEKHGGLYINYSRHRISDDTLALLFELANEINLKKNIDDLFSGRLINNTEQRPALHTALRLYNKHPVTINGIDICKQIKDELEHMENYISRLHMGEIKGHSGKTVNTLINIGTGGSFVGPRFVYDALSACKTSELKIHFIANVDYREINDVLKISDPETTVFIISSKSFLTAETLVNAQTAKHWLNSHGCNNIDKHFVAVTANTSAAKKFGIPEENIFRIWDWVGGRYSVWSATGLPVAAGIGMENFYRFLSGAGSMDEHFRMRPYESNIPVILGLLDTWYINYFNTESQAIIPYDQSLKYLVEYLGQLIMESNGKSLNRENKPVSCNTSPVIWGGVGTNVQHTFMQLLHQGTRLVPVDFLVGRDCREGNELHHNLLLSNCLAQGEALMNGNIDKDENSFKKVNGNNPSTTVIYDKLTPETLGMLLAMYEHRTFVQAMIWNINPFDQWGVELGKKISGTIMTTLDKEIPDSSLDAVTHELIKNSKTSHKQ